MRMNENSFFCCRSFVFDMRSFDDKHQHVWSPASLVTGLTGHVAEKLHSHVQTYRKPAKAATDESSETNDSEATVGMSVTSKRPTLIDFMGKFKSKRSIDGADCGCNGNTSIADGIGEHLVEKNDERIAAKSTYQGELEEMSSSRSKRSNDDNSEKDKQTQTDATSCSAASACSKPTNKKQTKLSSDLHA